MKGLGIDLFGKRAFESLKNSINEMQEAFMQVDLDDFESKFSELRKDFSKKFDDIVGTFKEMNGEYKVEVPYDRNTQTLTYTISDGKMTVTTESHKKVDDGEISSASMTSTTIPSDVIVDNVSQKYLKDEKKMIFTFKKKPKNNAKVESARDQNDEAKKYEIIGKILTYGIGILTEDEKKTLYKYMKRDIENGDSFKDVALRYKVSDRTVRRWYHNDVDKK